MIKATTETLEILYHDNYIVAINKPSDLLVHKSPIDKHETKFALQEVRNLIGEHIYPVHRLDKPTSGVLLFALNKEIAKVISKDFQENRVKKEYTAIVRGYTKESGTIEHPIKQMLDTKEERLKRFSVFSIFNKTFIDGDIGFFIIFLSLFSPLFQKSIRVFA